MNANNNNAVEFDVLDHLDNSTIYSRGIYNILDLSLNDLDENICYDNYIKGFDKKINGHRDFNNIKFSQYIYPKQIKNISNQN